MSDNGAASGASEKKISTKAMMAKAMEETGLGYFGSREFLEPFEQLVKGANEDIAFNPIGRMSFEAETHRFLVNRLRFEEDVRLHPEILDEDVADPIVVLGLPRTGTSKLQRMLSADPQTQKLYFWKQFNPAPFPGAKSAEPDPRIEIARQAAAMLAQLSPEFMAAHPTVAEDVDEDLLLQYLSFETVALYLGNPTQQYYDWIKQRKLHYTYRYERRLLQYMQWQDGGKQGRPWILKSPLHMGNLDVLLEVFPKATLVHCHRDIGEVVSSFSRLQETLWRLKTDAVDMHEVGRTVVELWSTEMDKYLELRKQMGPRLNILDVSYEQIAKDPMSVIEALYQRVGLALGEDSREAILAWERQNPKDRFGKNRYTQEQYGLTTANINAAFKNYLQQFGQYTAKGAHHVV